MPLCASCGAALVFGLTEAGHWLPLDADPNPAGEWRLFGDIPRAVHVPPERRDELAAQLLIAHWATCPSADRHRKRNPKQR
jgi:hypothetical protein